MEIDFRRHRIDYTLDELDVATVDPNPFNQFRTWFSKAEEAQPYEPNAMAIATATSDGRPSVRMVLLKGFDENGLCFFTNYESRKGQEIEQNPYVAVVFYWDLLQRQIRVEGALEKLSHGESKEYFRSRPRNAQIGALASQQSAIIPDRSVIETRVEKLTEEFEGQDIPLPPYWGGYRITPLVFEFWQGRKSRLHDRIRYTLQEDRSWLIERLSP